MTQQSSVLLIDARGLNCPLPVLKLRKRLKDLPPGAAVELLATDPAAARDVPAFCRAHGHAVETGQTGPETGPGSAQATGTLRFFVRKAG